MRISSSFLLVLTLSAAFPVQGAYAGFDWVPPIMPAAAPPAGEPMQMPTASDMPSVPGAASVESQPIAPLGAGQDIAVVPQASPPTNISASTDAPASAPKASKGKRAVYPPRDNLAAAPLKGNRSVENMSAPARKPIADPVEPGMLPPETSSGMNAPSLSMHEPMQEGAISHLPVEDRPMRTAMAPVSTEPMNTPNTPAPRHMAVIEGFGNGIPLSVAMEQIIPADFSVNYQDQPNPDTTVSWAGGRPWDKVLEDMLYAHGYRVMVGQKTVTLFKAGRTPSVTTKNLAPAEMAPTRMASLENVGVPVPAPQMDHATAMPVGYQAQKVDIFSARAGESANEVLARWSKQAMVELYWDAGGNFMLPGAVAYNATFTRAVEQVLGQFRGQAARPIAELHPNAPTGPVVLSVRSAADNTLVVR